jgi:hypothetical protein
MNPHIKDAPSPLRALIGQALRRYGDFSGASVQGEAASMFLEFANAIVDDWVFHPTLSDIPEVSHYISVDEARDVPDVVMLQGLLLHYAAQQVSEKFPVYQGQYYQALNREALKVWSGGRNRKIEMRVMR